MAAAVRNRALHLDSRSDLVRAQNRVLSLRLSVGARDIPTLPLRSAHAARLESVPAAVARLGGPGGRISGTLRQAADGGCLRDMEIKGNGLWLYSTERPAASS